MTFWAQGAFHAKYGCMALPACSSDSRLVRCRETTRRRHPWTLPRAAEGNLGTRWKHYKVEGQVTAKYKHQNLVVFGEEDPVSSTIYEACMN
jgi:hypothetical protein